ncbi:MAG: hypothetical protein IPN17_22065 [Deltaproteobacteria bacterium]|nr:hypothetical protein [Deltaproteobacteria bacterium]
MTNHTTFWTVLAVVTFPALLLTGLFCVIVPGLNLMLIPLWSFVAMAYVGGFSNEIERCRRLAQRAPAALRKAPGVVAVQRVNAL